MLSPIFFLRATPVAYRNSRARGHIGAQLPAYTTATTPDPSLICGLYHSLLQCWILNPLSKARD